MPQAPGPLGFISEPNRNAAQHAAHAAAAGLAVAYSLPVPVLAKGQAIALFKLWQHPDVVTDVGFVFTRFHQLTGSCVNCGGANAVYTSVCSQRVAADSPTKAFLPFTWHNYAMSRHYYGDDGQGEGSMGSTWAKSVHEDGIRDWVPGQTGIPQYTDADGISITSREEMAWSSVRNPNVNAVLQVSKPHTFGSAGECRSAQDIRAMIGNGYGVTFACDRFIGNAHVEGSGDKARVIGFWDGSGGHQQSVHAVEEHEDFGPLYWVQNNWPGNTYPKDPGGGPVCGCWVREAKVEQALRYHAEVYGLSHLSWFPAQPKIPKLDFSSL